MIGFEPVLGNLGTAFGGSALAVVGVQLALFAYLDHRGLLDVHWQAVDQVLADVHQSFQTIPPWLTALGATVPLGAGFIGGVLFGFKKV